jgi:hypothetical protein
MDWKREIGWKWAALLVVCFAIGCGGNVRETPSQDDRATGFAPRFPARAALSFSTAPAPGMLCEETNPTIGFPIKYNASVQAELECDPSMGCKPDDYIVVDGDPGTSVACNVKPQDSGYAIQLNLDVDGSATNAPPSTSAWSVFRPAAGER